MNSLRLWFGFVAVATCIVVGQSHATFILQDLSLHAGGGVAWIQDIQASTTGLASARDRGDHQTGVVVVGADYRLLPKLSLTASYLDMDTIENGLSYPPDIVFIAPPPDRIAYHARALLTGFEVRPFQYDRIAFKLGAGAAFTRTSAEERGGFYPSPRRTRSGVGFYWKAGTTISFSDTWSADAEWLSFPVDDIRFEGDDSSIGAVVLSLSYHFR